MSDNVVDVRSDTVSLPTPEMRERMANAVVGDDVYGEDPTVAELEAKMAALFGKEAGLFVPSGTMGNLLAVMVHCNRRGSEAIVGNMSHIFLYEQGSSASMAGVQLATIRNRTDGTFCLQELRQKIRQYEDIHEPITSLIVVENTQNICGGKVMPLSFLDELVALVREQGVGIARIGLHMDGARVFNAAAALDVSVERIARGFDSVSVCLSKGLSAPVGSVLVGSKDFIKQAHRLRKALGGAMRQSGILAAGGLVALEQVVPLLKKDHEHARRIAESIAKLNSSNITVDLPNVQTNILLIQIKQPKLTASEFASRLAIIKPEELAAGVTGKNGAGIVVKASARNWEFMRMVFYHQVKDDHVDMAIKKLSYVIKEYDALWA